MVDNKTDNFNDRLARLKQVMFHLRITDGIELAKALNYSQGYISEILNEKKGIPKMMGQRLEDYLSVNRKWFATGIGEMFLQTGEKSLLNPYGKSNNTKSSDNDRHNKTVGHDKRKYNTLTPMYDNSAAAGDVEVYSDINNEGPAFYVNIPQFKDCKFGKSVFGHSMFPTITSGCYVFCKPVTIKANFIPGEIYYMEYDNFGVCTRLQKGLSPDEVLLVFDNDELRTDGSRRYESYAIKIDVIRELFLVKGFFNQNHN